MKSLPEQRVPQSKKNKTWKEDTVKAIIDRTDFRMGTTRDRYSLLKMYEYYNGEIDPADYRYVTEPYGKERGNYPARIRNYQIIKPVVDLLLGEKSKRPFNYTVVVTNPDVITLKEEAKNQTVLEAVKQLFVNQLNEAGMETGVPSEEVEMPEHVAAAFERTWKDNRAIMGQEGLNFILQNIKWYHHIQKAWFDFLVAGECYTHKGVRNGQLFWEVLNPLDIDYDRDPEVELIEDGEWCAIRRLVHRSSAIDFFHDELTEEEIDQLRDPVGGNKDTYGWSSRTSEDYFGTNEDLFEWTTVYWKSLKRVGFYSTIDEYGDEVVEMVTEDDPLPEGYNEKDIEWEWINEVWQGHILDDRIFIGIEPLENVRRDMDNPSLCKLPVNGRKYSERNTHNISLVSLGIPYQLIYNIFKFRLENAIAKSKDIFALLDINMIPEKWDMDKFMYHVEATGVGWLNYQKEGIQFNPQHQTVLDLSIRTIAQYVELLRFIKEEWEDLSGVSRQRKGQTSQYELKSTTEQSIIQSSHITEDYYRKFAQFEEAECQGLLDFSKAAFRDGKKGMYVTSDLSRAYINIDGELYAESNFGIFVADAHEETQKIEQLKALGQASMQNGTPLSLIADILDTKSFVQVKEKIKEAEKLQQQFDESSREMEEQMFMREQEIKERGYEHDILLQEMSDNTKIEIALINKEQEGTESEEGKTKLAERKLELEERKAQLDNQLKNKELEERKRANRSNERLKEKQINKPKPSTK